jgi:hypothetical protein
MKTCIEHLPIELWIEIFSYLEAHILLQAFTNLNHHFDQLLTSDYVLFNVRLGIVDRNPLEYSIKSYWSESILNYNEHLLKKNQEYIFSRSNRISRFKI